MLLLCHIFVKITIECDYLSDPATGLPTETLDICTTLLLDGIYYSAIKTCNEQDRLTLNLWVNQRDCIGKDYEVHDWTQYLAEMDFSLNCNTNFQCDHALIRHHSTETFSDNADYFDIAFPVNYCYSFFTKVH